MVQLQEILPEIEKLGYQLLAASPDQPDVAQQNATDLGITFPLMCDPDLSAAQALGIAWDTRDQSEQLHQLLENASGEAHHLLLVPAIYIIDTDGVIQFEYINPNHQIRVDPDALLNELRAHQKRMQAE